MRALLFLSMSLCLTLAGCGSSSSHADLPDMALAGRAAVLPELEPEEGEVASQNAPEHAVDATAANDAPKLAAPVFKNTFSGSVDGMTLTPKYSFFMQGVITVGGSQPTLVVVQTNVPNLCQHIAQGTMPKNATMFAAALVQYDGGPVQTQYSYTAPGHHGLDQDPQSTAIFRRLDDSCEIYPGETGARAMYGQAVIRKLVPNTEVTVDYAFDFEDLGTIKGHVEAPYCDAPAFFANPEQFIQPIEPDACKDS